MGVRASNRLERAASAFGVPREGFASDGGALGLAAFAVAYLLSAELGHWLSSPVVIIATFWPPIGVFVAVLLLAPTRRWPSIVLTGVLANIATDVLAHQRPPALGLVFGTANATTAVLAALVVRRRIGDKPCLLESTREVFALLAGIGLGSACGATIACLALKLSAGSDFWPTMLSWWTGDQAGTWLVAPAILGLSCRANSFVARSSWNLKRALEAAAVLVSMVAASIIIFYDIHPFFTYPFLVLPILVWAALRFGRVGLSVTVLVMCVIAARAFTSGHGIFAHLALSPRIAFVELQLFVFVWTIILHLLATLLGERERAALVLQQTNDELEQRVECRTEQLATLNRALHEAEQRWAYALRGADVGVWDWDLTTNKVNYSSRWKSMIGYADDEIGDSLEEWTTRFHPDDLMRALLDTQAHLEGRTPIYMNEHRLLHKDGTYRWILDRGIAMRDDAGNAFRMIGSHSDITERKRAEEQRERLLEAERAARREMERVGHLKDEFLATLSHELRTPLTAILGWAHILKSSLNDPATVAKGLEVIARNAKLQSQLIQDLLDMSRIISGKLRMEVAPVHPHEVITAAVDAVRYAAEAKGVALVVDLSPDAPLIHGDAGRLQQVFWNLLSNAVKFTPTGGRVEIRERRTAPRTIEFIVTDTGQGIPVEFLPNVFDRFRQADGSATRKHGGLGLGLSIVKQLVELHGGTVRAESDGLGKGATFTVSLPIAEAPLASQTPARPRDTRATLERPEKPPSDMPSLRGVSMLVVDDQEEARDFLRRLLAGQGAAVSTAASGPDALAALKGDKPDVLLSDISMDGMDGYQLIREIREGLGIPPAELPAVALTAFTRPEDRERALRVGYQAHVPKPVQPAALVNAVFEVMRDARS